MTKSTSDSRKKQRQKKESRKYLATAPGTKLHRVEFIETHKYVNGVRNERGGELVIRALDESEKEWLSKFNATFEHGNFGEDFMELTPKERSEVNAQDYDRKNDLFFIARKNGALVNYDLMEYDKFVTEGEKNISMDDLKLNYLETNSPKKVKRKRAASKKKGL
jgi:hypothetical protein